MEFLHALEELPASLGASEMSLSVVQNADLTSWATALAVLWLHANGQDLKCEWELLERKAVAWIHNHAGRNTILRPHLLPS